MFSKSIFHNDCISALERLPAENELLCGHKGHEKRGVDGVVATISAQDGLTISEPDKMTLQ